MARPKKKLVENIRKELEALEEDYKELNLQNDDITKNILSDTKINELDENYTKLVENLMSLRKLTENQKYKEAGVFGKMEKYIKKFLPSKITDNIEKKFLEEKSLEEALQEMKTLQEFIVEQAGKHHQYYGKLYSDIKNSLNIIEERNKKLEKLEKETEKIEDKKEKEFIKFDIQKLKESYSIFESINKEVLNTIEYQIITYKNLQQKTQQLRPIIMSQLRVQLAIAQQNASLKRIEQAHTITKDVLNDFIKINSKNTNEAIKDAIKLANDNIIEEDTIKELIDNRANFQKEVKALISTINKKKEVHAKLIAKLNEVTEKENKDIPKLISGKK